MKVIAFNGSPRKGGNTQQALEWVATELENTGIDVEIVQVGNQKIRGCLACGACKRNKNEKCVIDDDPVNDWIQKMKAADGILLGSPTYYAGVAGTMKCFLDRAFYVAGNAMLRYKVGASVVAVRRSGGIPTFEQLNHYINYAEMMMPSGNYWNVVHGTAPGDAVQDKEGQQIMQTLGRNMAYLLKTMATASGAPEQVEKVYTHFIR